MTAIRRTPALLALSVSLALGGCRGEGGDAPGLPTPAAVTLDDVAKQFGDVVVLYGRFSVVLESQGKTNTLAGRLTEVFVRRAGHWWHPGWNLDLVSTP